MLEIPEEVKGLFRMDGIAKNLRIHFPNGENRDLGNGDIVSESLRFTESLCSQENLKFGLCEASVLEFETIGVGNIKGCVIEAEIDIELSQLPPELSAVYGRASPDVPYIYYPVPIGRFTVESCRRQADFKRRTVEAYSYFVNDYTKNPVETMKESYSPMYDTEYDFLKYVCSNLYRGANIPFPKERLETETTWTIHCGGDAEDDYELTVTLSGAVAGNVIRVETTQNYKVCHDMFGLFYTGLADTGRIAKRLIDVIREQDTESAVKEGFYGVMEDLLAAQIHPHLAVPDSAEKGTGGGLFSGELVVPVTDCNLVYAYPLEGTVRIPKKIVSAEYKIYGEGEVKTIELTSKSIPLCDDTSAIYRVETPDMGTFTMTCREDENGASYLDTANFPYGELAASYLELNALFGKAGRDGSYTTINIQDAFGVYPEENLYPEEELYPGDPADIVATSNYRSLWYEEYSVQPFGKVVADYVDEEGKSRSFSYVFDENAPNTYYMQDNFILLHTKLSQLRVKELLDTFFVPNARGITYIPAELEMKGLPYIEAGDVLCILTENGGMESFVFRRTLSGIFSLKDSVEALGDEINEDTKDIAVKV